MRKFVAIAAVAALSACTNPDGTLTAKSQNLITSMTTVSCVVDGIAQPLAVVIGTPVAVAAGFGPEATLAANIDAPLHQKIQDGCAALRGSVIVK
jgi:hypothetical protein